MGDFAPYVYRLTIRKKQGVVEQASESAKLWHWSCVTSNKLIQVLWTLILVKMRMKWSEVAQLCLTLCDPVDCSLPGSSVHGVFQARVLEWVAIAFSRGSSGRRDWTRVSCIAGRHFIVTIANIKFLLSVLGQVFSKPKSKSNGKVLPLLVIRAVLKTPWFLITTRAANYIIHTAWQTHPII